MACCSAAVTISLGGLCVSRLTSPGTLITQELKNWEVVERSQRCPRDAMDESWRWEWQNVESWVAGGVVGFCVMRFVSPNAT